MKQRKKVPAGAGTPTGTGGEQFFALRSSLRNQYITSAAGGQVGLKEDERSYLPARSFQAKDQMKLEVEECRTES